MAEVVMPRLSDSMEEGTILQWLKQVGDEIAVGEELVEIETDKANMAYEADVAGTLTEIVAEEGETLPIGAVIARIGDSTAGSGESAAGPGATAEGPAGGGTASVLGPSASAPPAEETPVPSAEVPAAQANAPAERQPSPWRADGRVKASPIAKRMAKEQGVDISRLQGSGPGGRVIKLDVERAASATGGGGAGGVEDSSARSASPPSTPGPARRLPLVWLPRILAAVVALYALQSLYAPDFAKSLQDICFFFVPFSLVFALLRDVEWDRRLLVLVLWVVGLEAVVFVLIGTVEYATRSLFWNDQVIRSNEFHTYFRVNSVFWDPNVYGRWLALAIVVAMAALLWARERRAQALLTALVALLWVGLAPTFSQSSLAALLAGLAVLAAVRWSVRWTLAGVAVVAVGAALIVTLVGGSKLTTDRINIDTSGRANLVSGGIHLFAQRPVYGYGSGSFPRAYREHVRSHQVPVSISHTQPITVAAEQGLVGLAAYLALLGTALWTLGAGLFGGRGVKITARAAVLAAFIALLVHTMAYAGLYEDPIAWVLLAAGAGLAAAPVRVET
jgi:O-antigen ligase